MTPTPYHLLKTLMNTVIDSEVLDRVAARLGRKPVEKIPLGKNFARTDGRGRLKQLSGQHNNYSDELYRGNIENYVGLLQVPVGIVGPLRINGIYANGDFQVPMATTEGALIASYNRGAKLIGLSGGATVMCTTDAISRAPGFVFTDILESSRFIAWCTENIPVFKQIAGQATRHGRLQDVQSTHDGNYVYLHFQYHTGDAAGQNMVTIATDLVCQHILSNSPVKPRRWYIDANMSGDKKATAMSQLLGRGKKVLAEVTIPGNLVTKWLHVSPQDMVDYSVMAMYGGINSGSIGVNGHFANALAGIYLACGQDVACVAESAIGTSRAEVTTKGDLYVCISMPNIVVGTVGGGTHLPTQRECLELMGCYGAGQAKKLAEICAAAALAGEISIAAAMAAGHFTRAHQKYGRPPQQGPVREYCCEI
ncbi:MAG: hydroxymethylglutaryl-CoA reductase [Candidatus Omnitrophica bacterium]|nr:hydroxymethylglutaryl-CoA reductase [Candidatus Omnitrophota bacterium]MCB9720405.1 hydroxymethylglutaryl-CoA reductase [Candidatus Omnitrophota bacterium]